MMTLEQQRQWVAKRRGDTASAVDLAAGMARERGEVVARLLRGGFGSVRQGGFGSVTWRGSLLLAAVCAQIGGA